MTVEVWDAKQYDVMYLFDQVKAALLEINFMLTNNTPFMQDPVTRKWRFGGYFESRWNAITNYFERNI